MWTPIERPGYFGRKKAEKIDNYNKQYGPGRWRLVWRVLGGSHSFTFFNACRWF